MPGDVEPEDSRSRTDARTERHHFAHVIDQQSRCRSRRRVRPTSRIRKRLPRDAVEPRKLGSRDVVDPPQGDVEDVGDDVLDEVFRRSAPYDWTQASANSGTTETRVA